MNSSTANSLIYFEKKLFLESPSKDELPTPDSDPGPFSPATS